MKVNGTALMCRERCGYQELDHVLYGIGRCALSDIAIQVFKAVLIKCRVLALLYVLIAVISGRKVPLHYKT